MPITLTNRQLHELIRPVVPFAGDTYSLPVLNTVLLQRCGDYLVASATDRYHLGVKRVRVGNPPDETQADEDLSVVVKLPELRQLLSLFKPARKSWPSQPKLTLEVADGILYAEAVPGVGDENHGLAAARIGCGIETADFPDLFQLMVAQLTAERPERVDSIAVNFERLTHLREAVNHDESLGNQPVVFTLGATDRRAIVAQVGADFIGALMPVGAAAGSESLFPAALTGWQEMFAALSKTLPRPAIAGGHVHHQAPAAGGRG